MLLESLETQNGGSTRSLVARSASLILRVSFYFKASLSITSASSAYLDATFKSIILIQVKLLIPPSCHPCWVSHFIGKNVVQVHISPPTISQGCTCTWR